MGGVTHSLSLCDCPTSFSMMSARSVHPTVACWTLPTAGFLLCTAWRTLPCIHIIRVLTCPTVSEHLGCFHVLAIVKKAAMNWSIQLSLWDFVFDSSGHVPRSGSAGSFSYYFFFLRRYCSVSIATVPFVFPPSVYRGSDLCTFSLIRSGFDGCYPGGCEAMSHSGFNRDAKHPFMCLCPLVCLLWRNVYSSPSLISESGYFFVVVFEL